MSLAIPNGSISEVLEAAELTLLASDEFQRRIKSAHAGDAVADHVHHNLVTNTDGLQEIRPYALLTLSSRGSNVLSEGVSIDLAIGGGILLLLEDVALGDTHKESYRHFCNWVGKIIDEMEALSGVDRYLAFATDMVFAPRRTIRSQQSDTHDYWSVVYLLRFGENA